MSKRISLEGKSEEYKKGYHCGYETAMQKQERNHRKKEPKSSNLVNVSKLRIVERGTWLHIEGDDETYICPFCENTTYCEGDYVPKFCMECGADMRRQRMSKKNLIGQYPSCDMLNNAIRFIFDGRTDDAISEIVFAIEKADGYLCDDIKERAKAIQRSVFKEAENEDV